MGTFYERRAAENLTLGGVRLFVNELLDPAPVSGPVRYRGFVDLGCVEEAPFTPNVEYQEHYCAHTGTRILDRKIVKQVSGTITVTLLELDVENVRLFFMGGTITPVAAGGAPVGITDEVVRLEGTERRILEHGFGTTSASIVVTDLTGVTTYSNATDYEVVSYYGWAAIRRRAGTTIGDGDYVLVDYNYTNQAHKKFNPVTSILKTAKVRFMGVSDTGPEMIAEFRNCNISPAGDFNWQSDDWTSMQLQIDVLDDSVYDSAAPFGVLKHFGSGTNL